MKLGKICYVSLEKLDEKDILKMTFTNGSERCYEMNLDHRVIATNINDVIYPKKFIVSVWTRNEEKVVKIANANWHGEWVKH